MPDGSKGGARDATALAPRPRRLIRGRNDEREFLPAALEVIDTPASPASRAIGATIVAAVAFALIWACVGKLDINATATGRVVPVGKIKTVQPLQSGVVRAIRVADGDHVTQGEVLVELDPTVEASDRTRYDHDLLQARLDEARLEGLRNAFLGNAPPVLVDPPAEATPLQIESARAAMVSQAAEQAAKLAALDQQIASKEAERAEAAAEVTRLQGSLDLVEQQAEIRRKLRDMQFGNKLAYLEAEQKFVEQQGEIVADGQREQEARASRLALLRQRDQAVAEYRKTVLGDLSKALEQVNLARAELTKATQDLTGRTLTAPIDGTVQQLAIHTVGGVVTPAQALMVVVPDHGGLEVEATVSNRDVGFVHVGQPVEVKVETFTFTRYGTINGVVTSLSRDVVYDAAGQRPSRPSDASADIGGDADAPKEPGYTARIALARNWIDTETGHQTLGPGMTVTAEIHTGERRIITYLLSPLLRRVDESLHER